MAALTPALKPALRLTALAESGFSPKPGSSTAVICDVFRTNLYVTRNTTHIPVGEGSKIRRGTFYRK